MKKLLTRREIIKEWNRNEKYHDFFCCPNCRDILTRHDNTLCCTNHRCMADGVYNLDGTEKE